MFCALPTTYSPKERKGSANPRQLSVTRSYQEHWRFEIKANYCSSFLRTLQYWAKSLAQTERINLEEQISNMKNSVKLALFFVFLFPDSLCFLLLYYQLYHTLAFASHHPFPHYQFNSISRESERLRTPNTHAIQT